MRASVIRAALMIWAVGALAGGCYGPKHPDPERYEYLYMNGAFQPPYTTFPSGIERGNWKCYDDSIDREFDCTFVRGGWRQYHYIYRARR